MRAFANCSCSSSSSSGSSRIRVVGTYKLDGQSLSWCGYGYGHKKEIRQLSSLQNRYLISPILASTYTSTFTSTSASIFHINNKSSNLLSIPIISTRTKRTRCLGQPLAPMKIQAARIQSPAITIEEYANSIRNVVNEKPSTIHDTTTTTTTTTTPITPPTVNISTTATVESASPNSNNTVIDEEIPISKKSSPTIEHNTIPEATIATETSIQTPIQTPTETTIGDSQAEAKIVTTPKRPDAVSTFVVVKERTEEAFSVAYIFGAVFIGFYTFWIVAQSLFSGGGEEHIQNKTFDLIKDDPRVMRAIGNDIFAKQVSQRYSFTDDDGQRHTQVIYYIYGSKGEARVDVEMINEKSQWEIQYCIVTAPFSVINIVDNRLGLGARATY